MILIDYILLNCYYTLSIYKIFRQMTSDDCNLYLVLITSAVKQEIIIEYIFIVHLKINFRLVIFHNSVLIVLGINIIYKYKKNATYLQGGSDIQFYLVKHHHNLCIFKNEGYSGNEVWFLIKYKPSKNFVKLFYLLPSTFQCFSIQFMYFLSICYITL